MSGEFELHCSRTQRLEDTAPVRLAKHDHVVEPFATDRSDQPLDVTGLPRRARRGRMIAYPDRTNAAAVSRTEYPVALAYQVLRGLIPREGISDLDKHHNWYIRSGRPGTGSRFGGCRPRAGSL